MLRTVRLALVSQGQPAGSVECRKQTATASSRSSWGDGALAARGDPVNAAGGGCLLTPLKSPDNAGMTTSTRQNFP